MKIFLVLTVELLLPECEGICLHLNPAVYLWVIQRAEYMIHVSCQHDCDINRLGCVYQGYEN